MHNKGPKVKVQNRKTWHKTGPVAGDAKKGLPNRKILAKLVRRQNDYDQLNPSKKSAYHRPGSMQK